jgi:pimeloyl-ACP methyl ester carboxylesterase
METGVWGSGQPVVFGHGWPVSADAWEDQMLFLGARGYRCIAHDRRGHGRSSQPWNGNEMDNLRRRPRGARREARLEEGDLRRPLHGRR